LTIYSRRGDRRGQKIKDTETIASMARVTPMLDQVVREISNLRLNTDDEIKDIIKKDHRLIILTPSKRLAGQYYFRDTQYGGTAEEQVENLLRKLMNNEDYLYRKRWLARIETNIKIKKFFKNLGQEEAAARKAEPATEYVPSPEILSFVRKEIDDYKAGLINTVTSYEMLAEKFATTVCAVAKAIKTGLDEKEKDTLFSYSKKHDNPVMRQRTILKFVREDLKVGRIWTVVELQKRFKVCFQSVGAALSGLRDEERKVRDKLCFILKIERQALDKNSRPTTSKEYSEKYEVSERIVSRMLQTMLSEEQMTLRRGRLRSSKSKPVLILSRKSKKPTGYMRFSSKVRNGILSQVRREIKGKKKASSSRVLTEKWGMDKNDLYDLFVANLTPEERESRRKLVAGRPQAMITAKKAKLLMAQVRREILAGRIATGCAKLVEKYGANERVILKLIKARLTTEDYKKRLLLLRKREQSTPPQFVAHNHEQKAASAMKALVEIKDNLRMTHKKSIVSRLQQILDLLK
jgi:hypothetical protein